MPGGAPTATTIAGTVRGITVGYARPTTATIAWTIRRITVGYPRATTATIAWTIRRVTVGDASATTATTTNRIGGIAISLRLRGRNSRHDGNRPDNRATNHSADERTPRNFSQLVTHYYSPKEARASSEQFGRGASALSPCARRFL
jgi:hypothetical protein